MATEDSRVPMDQGGVWLSLREAARQLGISEKTTRRRVKAGILEGRQEGTQHGPAWQVWVPTGGASAGTVANHGTQAVQGAGLAELVSLVERQQQTIMELSGRVGFLQAQNQQLQKALEAPRQPVGDAHQDASDQKNGLRPSRRAWWHFWG